LLISFCFIFFLATDIAHAAGILMRIQQMKALKQQRQQAQGVVVQQQGDQGQNPPPPPQLTYQQMVDQRNQVIAQAILQANQSAVLSENLQVINNGTINQVQPIAYAGAGAGQVITAPVAPQAAEVVDLAEVWKKLDKRSTIWSAMVDDQSKLLTVAEYIDRFHKEGVKINEPPLHYVQMIDQVVGQNPQILQRPFGELIQILAIVDYDFDNGMNKDDLAKKVLGEAGYEANKQRFSQQH